MFDTDLIRIFHYKTLKPELWKNGNGYTRPIAQSAHDMPTWRVSIADVDKDGAFSSFDQMTRILTVVNGHGMTLQHSDGSLDAERFSPLRFAGDLPIHGLLKNGPVQNFNLIYDSNAIAADVKVVGADQAMNNQEQSSFIRIIYCLQGQITYGDNQEIEPGSGLLVRGNLPVLKSCDQSRLLSASLSFSR